MPSSSGRPLSRRTLLTGSAAAAGAVALGASGATTGNAWASSPVTPRPTGADYVRYEDLYRSGDSVSAALARLTAAKIVTFPEGNFTVRDFAPDTQAAISIPRLCRGIVGSGRGDLGGSTGTVFTIAPYSSTKGNGARDSSGRLYVPVQGSSTPTQLNLMKQVSQYAPSTWQNFQLAGTAQGHVYSGFQVYGTVGANSFNNVLINGWEGDNGAPPGETSGLSVNGQGAHTVTSVEVDGRRSPGGIEYGAMGMTFQNTVGATFRNCVSHHCRCATFVMFESFNGYMIDCTSDSTVTSGRGIGGGNINLERTAGWTLVNPVITGRHGSIHISHSNDNWTLNRNGASYSTNNGSLKVVNPTYNDLWGDNMFYIQSWSPYWNGDTMRTPPLVTKADWSTHLRYQWVHGSHQIIS